MGSYVRSCKIYFHLNTTHILLVNEIVSFRTSAESVNKLIPDFNTSNDAI